MSQSTNYTDNLPSQYRDRCKTQKMKHNDNQGTALHTGCAKKSNPYEKFYISEIVADVFTKFAEFTDEDSVHISCKFY